jgi:CheY-like chemotaxis protein
VSDVSNRILLGHLEYMQRHGYNSDAFLNNLTEKYPDDPCLKPDFIKKPTNRIRWDSFTYFLDLLADWHKNDPNWESQFIEESIVGDADWARHAWTSLNVVTSPSKIYQVVCNFVGPVSFGNVIESKIEPIENGRLILELKIQDGHRDSPLFFKLARFGLAKTPRIIGLHEAIIEADIRPHVARYKITPPPSRTLFARIGRIVRFMFSSQNVLGELTLQDKELRQHYKELFDSETELRKIRNELEQRVESSKAVSSEISHHMNNILQGIFLNLELAGQKIDRNHPAFQHFESAKRFASRGQDAITRVLKTKSKSYQPTFDQDILNKNSSLKGDERILILDDEAEIAALMASSLSFFGYRATSTASAEDAYNIVECGDVDLVVTDFAMPTVSGFEATRRIKEIKKDLPIILLSGLSDQLPEEELQKLGYFASMKKPVETLELLRVLRSAFSEKAPGTISDR